LANSKGREIFLTQQERHRLVESLLPFQYHHLLEVSLDLQALLGLQEHPSDQQQVLQAYPLGQLLVQLAFPYHHQLVLEVSLEFPLDLVLA
jgi:hypothetical protein